MNVDKPGKVVFFHNRESAMLYYRHILGWQIKLDDKEANKLWRKWYQ